jgi:hypothetical protein
VESEDFQCFGERVCFRCEGNPQHVFGFSILAAAASALIWSSKLKRMSGFKRLKTEQPRPGSYPTALFPFCDEMQVNIAVVGSGTGRILTEAGGPSPAFVPSTVRSHICVLPNSSICLEAQLPWLHCFSRDWRFTSCACTSQLPAELSGSPLSA